MEDQAPVNEKKGLLTVSMPMMDLFYHTWQYAMQGKYLQDMIRDLAYFADNGLSNLSNQLEDEIR